jgi:hypothetical protein
MRLEKEEAFLFASQIAKENSGKTAFWRFADFENYYPRRVELDKYLYRAFIEMGGKPKELHPLYFVLHGSDYLCNWFDNGITKKISLKDIPDHAVSFTMGDSSRYLNEKKLTMHTKQTLQKLMEQYPEKGIEDFIAEETKNGYIEVQLWDDDYLKYCVGVYEY